LNDEGVAHQRTSKCNTKLLKTQVLHDSVWHRLIMHFLAEELTQNILDYFRIHIAKRDCDVRHEHFF